MALEPSAERPQRTYLRRRGRMTRGQARALAELGPRFVLAPEGRVDWPATFGRHAPLGVEIGFGMGHALLDWAAGDPGWNLVGIEVYEPGVGALLLGLQRAGLSNVRVLLEEAHRALAARFETGSVTEMRIYFPDPWPKKRHHKRRLVQPGFVAEAARVLAPGGRLRLATDWEDYAEWMADVLAGERAFAPAAAGPETRPPTNFERRGERLGHRVRDLVYVRKR